MGLLIYICFSIIKPEALWHWSVPAGNYSRIVAVALLLGWACSGFGRWTLGRAGAIAGSLVAYWCWACLSAAQAANPSVAWGFVENMAKIVLPFVVGITLIDSVRQLKQLVWVVLLSYGYVALELNLSYFDGYNRVQDGGFGGMDNNSIAIAMVGATGLAFFTGLSAGVWWHKMLAFGSALMTGHCVLLTFSRGGMLGMIVLGVVAFFLIPKQPKHYAAFAAASLLALRLAGPQVIERFSTVFADSGERDYSAQSRLDLWAACWDVMLKEPFVGVGPDHWQQIAHTYGFNPMKSAHNLWMETGADLGFPGLGFLVLFYVLCASRMWAIARGRDHVCDEWFRDAARMVLAFLAGFAVSATFVSLEGLESPYYVVLIGAGMLKINSTGCFPYNQTPVARSLAT